MARTLLIGLDGATFRVLNPLMDDGTMPFLREFRNRGTQATLMSTAHPLTPPAFLTMVTGRSPGHHGVFDFVRAEDKKQGVFFTLYGSRDIRCETLWSIASRQKKTVTSLNFVMTAPVSPVSGYVVPGMVQWKHLRRHIYPSSLFETLKGFPWFHPKTMCWDFDHIGKAIVGDYQTDSRGWVTHHIEREEQWFQIAKHLLTTDPSDLFSIVFDGSDKLQHICWEYLDPDFTPTNPSAVWLETRRMCLDYFRALDGFLRQIVEAAGPDARVFITSDHGFGPAHITFRVNQFLSNLGHLRWKDRQSAMEDGEKDFRLDLDWDATVAYCATRSSNGVFIRVADAPGEPGVPRAQYGAFRDQLIRELKALRNPENGQPLLKQILLREDVFPGPAMKEAPDLTLVLCDYGMVWTSPGDEVVEFKKQIKGTHYPEGILMAAGPGIARGVTLPARLEMTQVAPTLLYSLGLPIPSNFDVTQPAPLFEPASLAASPVQVGEPAWELKSDCGETPSPSATGTPDSAANAKKTTLSEEEKKAVYEQLRALGYVE
jgi:predicted AlkP superfamily phosphohydrolase/phosphomutase